MEKLFDNNDNCVNYSSISSVDLCKAIDEVERINKMPLLKEIRVNQKYMDYLLKEVKKYSGNDNKYNVNVFAGVPLVIDENVKTYKLIFNM